MRPFTVSSGPTSRATTTSRVKRNIRRLSATLNAVQMLAAFVVFLVLFCAAEPILGIYGRDFVAGAISLQILVATWLLRSSLGPQEMLLNIAGHERIVTMVHVLAVVLSLVFSLALVPMYGMTGAAIAHAIAWGGTGVLLYRDSCPQTRIARCPSSSLRCLAAQENRSWELRDTAFEGYA